MIISFQELASAFSKEAGAEESTMMGSPCLRHQGNFVAMMFDKQDALIIKVSPIRVLELIDMGIGLEFNYTGKRFKEWVLIPIEFAEDYEAYIAESLAYVKTHISRK